MQTSSDYDANGNRVYRYGYQGSEKDFEITNVTGAHITTFFREFDTRLNRTWSNDPVFQPWQSPYTSMDNNPIWFNDPLGDKVDSTLTKGGGEDGRDLITIKMTGKMINESGHDLDMKAVIEDTKKYIEDTFTSSNVEGVDYKFELDFTPIEKRSEMKAGDHLIVIADNVEKRVIQNGKDVYYEAAGVSKQWGNIAYIHGGKIAGLWDENFSSQPAYIISHEIGHMFGLGHSKNPFNLMKEGTPWFSASSWLTVISDAQISYIMKTFRNLSDMKINKSQDFPGYKIKRK